MRCRDREVSRIAFVLAYCDHGVIRHAAKTAGVGGKMVQAPWQKRQMALRWCPSTCKLERSAATVGVACP